MCDLLYCLRVWLQPALRTIRSRLHRHPRPQPQPHAVQVLPRRPPEDRLPPETDDEVQPDLVRPYLERRNV